MVVHDKEASQHQKNLNGGRQVHCRAVQPGPAQLFGGYHELHLLLDAHLQAACSMQSVPALLTGSALS